jgi:hypothetical protein
MRLLKHGNETSKKQNRLRYDARYVVVNGSEPWRTHQEAPLFFVDLRTRFDYIGRLFGDSDDRRGGVTADLVWEYGRVHDAEALDAEYTELRVDDARLGGSANTCGGRLQ